MGFMFTILEVVERKGFSYPDEDIDGETLVTEVVTTRPYIREDGKALYGSLGEALAELGLPKNKGKDLMISPVE
jgi:S-adenosylmethionine synthetase